MKWLLSALLALVPLLATPEPAASAQNRPFSRSELGCEFFTGYSYDGDLTFYARNLKFYTLNPEWKAKYRSARCSRLCKVFLYERPQMKLFFESVEAVSSLKNRLVKAQSAMIHCANDGDMARMENFLHRQAKHDREKEKSAPRLKHVPKIGDVELKRKLP